MKQQDIPEELDPDKLAEVALGLLALTLHDRCRVWKGLDWSVMNLLHERGWITDPATKAKSVLLTDAGLARAEQLLLKHFRRRSDMHVSSTNLEQLASRVSRVSRLKGEFRLRSGVASAEYFDKYQFESDPQLLREISAHLVPLVPSGTEVLAGLELGGVAIATALSLATGLPVAFVRKNAKTYGTCRLAEGAAIQDRRVLVVEDVVTSGGQIVASTHHLRDSGAKVSSALCVIDREGSGKDALAEIDLKLISLFTKTDLDANFQD